jgi:hypothetical protein
MAGEDTDVGGDDDIDDLDEMLWNVESEFNGRSRNDKFSQIMKDYETPLFSGCKREHNKFWQNPLRNEGSVFQDPDRVILNEARMHINTHTKHLKP